MAAPLSQLFLKVLETVFTVDLVIESEASIFVAHSLLVLGVHEDFKHINEEASVDDC